MTFSGAGRIPFHWAYEDCSWIAPKGTDCVRFFCGAGAPLPRSRHSRAVSCGASFFIQDNLTRTLFSRIFVVWPKFATLKHEKRTSLVPFYDKSKKNVSKLFLNLCTYHYRPTWKSWFPFLWILTQPVDKASEEFQFQRLSISKKDLDHLYP